MFKELLNQLKTGFILLLLFSIITGIIYPYLITGIAQFLFPWQANGSLISLQNKTVGSLLIGQNFNSANYFWGRPSATSPYPYNAARSAASNLGPSNPDLLKQVEERVNVLRQSYPEQNSLIPVDLVTSSASGLDPDITPQAAFFQIPRIAKARAISESELEALIQAHIKKRTWGILGENRVNVLELNLALDKLLYTKEH